MSIQLKVYLKFILQNFFSYTKYEYYQGFHEIALYVILIFGMDTQTVLRVLEKISEYFLKDYMNKNIQLETTLSLIKHLVTLVIEIEINESELDMIIAFPLQWILCLFTQNISNIRIVFRILDYLLCTDPITIYYLAVNVILYEKDHLL